MALAVSWSSCFAQAPKGKLTYCSCSRSGAAGLGKDYFELVSNPGQSPKVVVVLNFGNRFGDPVINAEYTVDQSVVDSLQQMLSEAKVYELNGYSVEEHMTGGTTYRIYQEYDSGEKINAHWYGHHIKSEAWDAYYMIEGFFKTWREQARRENDPAVSFEIVAKRVAGRGTDHFMLLAGRGFTPRVIYDLNLDSRFKEEVHEQFNLESEEDQERVKQLQQDLIELKARSLGDYTKDDYLEDGTIYSVELKYASGACQVLNWHSKDVDPTAEAVYDRIRAFFTPWVK